MRVMILDDEQLILNHLKEILSQFEILILCMNQPVLEKH